MSGAAGSSVGAKLDLGGRPALAVTPIVWRAIDVFVDQDLHFTKRLLHFLIRHVVPSLNLRPVSHAPDRARNDAKREFW